MALGVRGSPESTDVSKKAPHCRDCSLPAKDSGVLHERKAGRRQPFKKESYRGHTTLRLLEEKEDLPVNYLYEQRRKNRETRNCQ